MAVERHGESGLLRSLAVAEEARGTGLGRRLVEAAEALAAERGDDALYLLTETAEPFFARRGYAVIDRAEAPEAIRQSAMVRTDCSGASVCSPAAVCMTKPLAEG